jgi:gliding motility-associated-like protein
MTFRVMLAVVMLPLMVHGQTLIINEVSNGPTGNQEYVEFVVADNALAYDCVANTPPCIDIRGWIFDDNSGYHGSGGIAAGAMRFSNNPMWACVPIGTIIVMYNGLDRNVNMPPDDVSLNDGNCRIIAPASNAALFEGNMGTPGAVSCSYPATGWVAGGDWTFTFLANSGDCARIVDLSGCEVFSVCWASCSSNSPIYFESLGSGSQNVWYLNDGDPFLQANWSEGSTVGNTQETPGAPNNAANATYIGQFNNNCVPLQPMQLVNAAHTDADCGCTATASATATGSIPGYTFEWTDAAFAPIGQTGNTAAGLCAGVYHLIATSSIGCADTVQFNVLNVGTVSTTVENISVCPNTSITYPDGATAVITAATSHTATLADAAGCDSVIVTNVTLLAGTSHVQLLQLCTGSGYVFPDGTTLSNITSAQSHVSTLTGSAGCDSIITTNITVADAITVAEEVRLCMGEDHTFPDGTVVNAVMADQVHTSQFVTATGCDSLVVTTLLVATPTATTSTVTVCANETVTYPDGSSEVITGDRVQVSSFVSTAGCDSVITTVVTLAPTYSLVEEVQRCSGSDVTFPDGTTAQGVTSSMSHTSVLATTAGCDSIITTNVTITTVLTSQQDITLCQGSDHVFADGTTATAVLADQSHTSSFISQSGCDSLFTENLIVILPITSTANASVCINSPYVFPDGTTEIIAAPTVHNSLLTSVDGCDSLVVTTVVPQSATIEVVSLTVCAGTSVTFPDGSTIIALADITQTSVLASVAGCDSTVTTNVTVLPLSSSTEVISLCPGESYTLPNGTVVEVADSSQTFTTMLASSSGCDSLVQIEVVPMAAPVPLFSSTADSSSLETTVQFTDLSTGAFLTQWTISTLNGTVLTTALDTAMAYTFPEGIAGTYQVCLEAETRLGCSATYCDTVRIEPHIAVYIPNSFTPNGNGLNDQFMPIISGVELATYELLVYTRWGEQIFVSSAVDIGWDGTYAGSAAQLGVYVYQISFTGTHSNRIYRYREQINLVR